jgi:hypothetical protein
LGILGAEGEEMLEVISLREPFDRALDQVFSEVPFEERLEVTRRALAHWGLSEEIVWKGALPGAINGNAVPEGPIRWSPVHFVRYGSLVLGVKEGYEAPDKRLPRGVWALDSLTTPLIFPYWMGLRGALPAPLLEGVEKALALVAEEVRVTPLPPLPESTTRILHAPVLVGGLFLLHFEAEGGPEARKMLLVSGAGGGLSLELFSWGDPLDRRERKREASRAFERTLFDLSRGKPAFFPEEELVKLLETDEFSGEMAIVGLRHPKAFPFLSL